MSRHRPAVLSALLVLAAAGPASAAQFYVDDNGAGPPTPGCQSAGHPCTTIAAALAASRALAGTGDTINLDAGLYNEDVVVDQPADNGLTIDGERSGLVASSISHTSNAAATVQLGASAPPYNVGLSLKDVVVSTGGASAAPKQGVALRGVDSSLQNVGISITDSASTGSGLSVAVVSGTTILTDIVVASKSAGPGMMLLTLGAVAMSRSGVAMASTAGTANGIATLGDIDIDTTLVRVPPGSDAPAISVQGSGSAVTLDSSLVEGGTSGILAQASTAGTTEVLVRRSTIDAATAGVDDAALPGSSVNVNTSANPAAVAKIDVVDSLLVDRPHARATGGVGTPSVTCANSILPLLTAAFIACDGAGANTFAAPSTLFVDAFALDYALRSDSPAIDRGAAGGPAAGEPATDQAGKPRSVDGNFDCAVRPDLGAREIEGQANTAPSVTVTGATAGSPAQVLDHSATGTDPEDGGAVGYAWAFSDGATAAGAAVQHAFATAGAHSATVTVTDSRGCTGLAKLGVEIGAGAIAENEPSADADQTPPVISGVSRRRARLRLTLSEAARVTAKIARRSCRRVAGGRRCRFRTRRTLTAAAQAGPRSIRLPVRALGRGRYRVTLVAVDAANNRSKAVRVRFRLATSG